MSPENFCYWLQGYFELHQARMKCGESPHDIFGPEQYKEIKNHLGLVFKKETPSFFPTDQTMFCGEKAAEDIFVNYKFGPSC